MVAVVVREGVSYRFIEPDDPAWLDVEREHLARGVDPPKPGSVRVAVASTTRGTSFYCLQPQLRAEPLFLHPSHRGTSVLVNLLAMMQAYVEQRVQLGADVWVVADTPETVRMCEAMQMDRVESPVYVKRVSKEVKA